MAELLEVDGVSLREEFMGVSTRTGRYSLPSLRGEDTVIAGRSGYRFVPNKPVEAGVGALSAWVIGATKDEFGRLVIPQTHQQRREAFESNLGLLTRMFTQRHRLSEIRAATPDGTVRRAFVQWTEWGEPEVQAGGTRAEVSIGYTIPDVWWEDENLRTQETEENTSLDQTLQLTEFAGMTGVIEDAVLTVTGPIDNPRITEPETGGWVEITGTVPTGQEWVVDVANATSVLDGDSVITTTKHVGGYRLLTIPNCYGSSDVPRLVLSGSNAGAQTKFGISARRKWAHA